MSGFSSLNIAVTGLNAAQRAVDVASQNVANVNTPGYSRQRVELVAVSNTTQAHFYTGGNETIFEGVRVKGIERIHDQFLEAARVSAGGTLSNLQARASALGDVESLFNEPSENGIQASLDEFFSGWHGLALQPDDAAAAGRIFNTATGLVNQLASTATGIEERWAGTVSEVDSAISELNQASKDLAGINQQILEANASDRPANELLDQRDMLVRQISDLAGGRAVQSADGTVNVLVGGVSVVSGNIAISVERGGGATLADAAAGDPPKIVIGSLTVPVSGGRIAGQLAAVGSDLPTLAGKLDDVALALRDAVNTVHRQGWTAGGDTNTDFFAGTGAKDLSVVPTTVSELAVSDANGTVSGTNAQAIADLAIDTKAEEVLGSEGPSELMRSLTAELGTKLQGLNRAAEVQETVFAAADAAVDANSGVNIDEEMTNLLMYQRSYQASARVITAVDEMMDTLINRTAP